MLFHPNNLIINKGILIRGTTSIAPTIKDDMAEYYSINANNIYFFNCLKVSELMNKTFNIRYKLNCIDGMSINIEYLDKYGDGNKVFGYKGVILPCSVFQVASFAVPTKTVSEVNYDQNLNITINLYNSYSLQISHMWFS